MFIAKDFHPFLDVATAFTIKFHDVLNICFTLFQLLTFWTVPSPKSHSILSTSQLVSGEKATAVGNHLLIHSTSMKKLNHKSAFHNGVWSSLLSNKEIITWLLSSTIQIGFFSPSPSISSSHTFHIPSLSSSYWFRLYTYGQLSFPFVTPSQS